MTVTEKDRKLAEDFITEIKKGIVQAVRNQEKFRKNAFFHTYAFIIKDSITIDSFVIHPTTYKGGLKKTWKSTKELRDKLTENNLKLMIYPSMPKDFKLN